MDIKKITFVLDVPGMCTVYNSLGYLHNLIEFDVIDKKFINDAVLQEVVKQLVANHTPYMNDYAVEDIFSLTLDNIFKVNYITSDYTMTETLYKYVRELVVATGELLTVALMKTGLDIDMDNLKVVDTNLLAEDFEFMLTLYVSVIDIGE